MLQIFFPCCLTFWSQSVYLFFPPIDSHLIVLFICLLESLMLNSEVSSVESKLLKFAMLRSLMKINKSKVLKTEPYFVVLWSELKILIETNWDPFPK